MSDHISLRNVFFSHQAGALFALVLPKRDHATRSARSLPRPLHKSWAGGCAGRDAAASCLISLCLALLVIVTNVLLFLPFARDVRELHRELSNRADFIFLDDAVQERQQHLRKSDPVGMSVFPSDLHNMINSESVYMYVRCT